MINICNAVPFQIKKEQFSSIQNGRERERERERESESVCLLVYERKIKREFM